MRQAPLDVGAVWLWPGSDNAAARYVRLFGRLFTRFESFDYRLSYLDHGPAGVEQRIRQTMATIAPQLVIFSQVPNCYAYLRPEFIAELRRDRLIVGLGFDDEMYFDQSKYFYQACTAVITTDIAGAAWLNQVGIPAHIVLTAWLNEAGDPTRTAEDIDVSFVGDMTKPGRRDYVRHLEREAIAVADFGHGSRNGPLREAEVADVFRRTKINLNFTATNPPWWTVRHDPLRARVTQLKGRPFELAALGRFCLCEWAPCVEHWFRPNVEIGVFGDRDDLVQQVQEYLANDDRRRAVAASARERYRADLAPEVQFTRVFSQILTESTRRPIEPPAPLLGGPSFHESMGRSRGVAFLYALHRGTPLRALREIFMKWSWHLHYWRGFVEAVIGTTIGWLRRP